MSIRGLNSDFDYLMSFAKIENPNCTVFIIYLPIKDEAEHYTGF